MTGASLLLSSWAMPPTRVLEQRLLLLSHEAAFHGALLGHVVQARADLARLLDPAHGAADEPRPAAGYVECELMVRRRYGAMGVGLEQREERGPVVLAHPLGERCGGNGDAAEIEQLRKPRVVLMYSPPCRPGGPLPARGLRTGPGRGPRLARCMIGLEEFSGSGAAASPLALQLD